MIEHYKKLGINPMTKTLLFSDSLDFSRANDIFETYHTQAMVAFGIGTFLSNDTDIAKPLNIVMKPIMANGTAIAKVSDTPGKGMCQDQAYIDYLMRCIKWRMEYE
jgi:nicotinate phosphoribosyltransferase